MVAMGPLGWEDGVEICEIPLKSEIKDGWLCHAIDESGRPTKVVTQVNGDKFNEFCLDIVTRKSTNDPQVIK